MVAAEQQLPVAQHAKRQCQRSFVQNRKVYVIQPDRPGKTIHHTQTEVEVAVRGHVVRKQNCAIDIAVRSALAASIRPEQNPQQDFRDRRKVFGHSGHVHIADHLIHDAIIADGLLNGNPFQ